MASDNAFGFNATTAGFNVYNYSTTDFYPTTTQVFEINSLTSGMYIALIYAICHLTLMSILAARIYYESIKQGQPWTLRHFFLSLWRQRGIYSPLLIHIYDTATDVGVIYEWYQLAQIEKAGTNLKSIDMEQFFWTAVGFMIAYRSLLGICTGFLFVYGFLEKADELKCCKIIWKPFEKLFNAWENLGDKCCLCLIPLYLTAYTGALILMLTIFAIGFVFGALELMIFGGIYFDFKRKQDDGDTDKGAGDGQKVCQATEGVLESLPEVIMQSVFIMRSVNDPTLLAVAEGDIKYLIWFSILASLLSITSKYVWIDEVAVKESAKELMMKKRDDDGDDPKDVLLGNCTCVPTHYISYGYIIRLVWRISAVTARFAIFALIWVVLGGAFEIVMIPTMMILWYIAIFSYAFCGDCALITTQCKRGVKNFRRSQRILNLGDDVKQSICGINWFVDCAAIVMFSLAAGFVVGGMLFALCLVGVVFQLGIAVLTGRVIYFIRMVENSVLMILVCIFAFIKFDCDYCADKHERYALENEKILVWIIAGWIAVIIHTFMTFKMQKVIDPEWDMDVGTIVENLKKDLDKQYQEYLKLHQKLIRTARVRAYMRRYTKEQIVARGFDRLIPNCKTCDAKLAPINVIGSKTCHGCACHVAEDDEEGIDVVWHCIQEKCDFDLCVECGHIEFGKHHGAVGTMLKTATTILKTPTTLNFDVFRPKEGIPYVDDHDQELELIVDDVETGGDKTGIGEGDNIHKSVEVLITGEIELGKVKSKSIGSTATTENAEEDSDNGLNDDDEKESEYVTPGGE